jgi:hypothetical protein
MSKRRRKGKRNRKPKPRVLRPTVQWPFSLYRSLEEHHSDEVDPPELTPEEFRATQVCPVATGLGIFPRAIADEDYVAACQIEIKTGGLAQFWVNFLATLRQVAEPYLIPHHPHGDDYQVPPYPDRIVEDLTLPMPRALMRGDRGAESDEWKEGHVAALTANPVLAGVPPFAPVVPEDLWLSVMVKQTKRDGFAQVMVDTLHVLRKVYSFPGGGPKQVPFGYKVAEDEDQQWA